MRILALQFDPDDAYDPNADNEIATTEVTTLTTTTALSTVRSTTPAKETLEVSVNATHLTLKVFRQDIAIGVLSGFLVISGNTFS